jgi:hypothetical protein
MEVPLKLQRMYDFKRVRRLRMNASQYKYVLKLLASNKKALNFDRPYDQKNGFSLPLVVAIALIITIGGAAIANRAFDGVISAAFSGRSREAQKVAEAGAAYFISQFNRPQNRSLLIRTGSDDTEGDGSIQPLTAVNSTGRINACIPGSSPSYASIIPTGGFLYLQSDGSVSSTPSPLRFRLDGVQRGPRDNLFIGKSPGTTEFTIRVTGEVLRNSQVISQATLEQEYDVAPKCCGVTFGGIHGSADYSAGPSGTSLCVRDSLGLGILAGASNAGTGSIDVKGKASSFISQTQAHLSTLFTALGLPIQTAQFILAGLKLELRLLTQNCRFVPVWDESELGLKPTPLGAFQLCTITKGKSSSTTCSDGEDGSSGNFIYCFDGNCAENIVVDSGVSEESLPPFCKLKADENEIHCASQRNQRRQQ